LTLGHAYSGKATLKRPADSSEILQIIRSYNSNDPTQHIIIQELVIYLGMLIKLKPEWFADMQTIRAGHLMQLIVARQKRRAGAELDQAFEQIVALPPHQLLQLLQDTLEDYRNSKSLLGEVETLHYDGDLRHFGAARFTGGMNPGDKDEMQDWFDWREQQGSVGGETEAFYKGVWELLTRCSGLVIGEKINSKNRIDSEITLAQMTPGEQSFKLLINHLLNKIQAPVYRQLTVEALMALNLIFQKDQGLKLDDSLYIDIMIGHAVKQCWLQSHPEHRDCYESFVSQAWQAFYQLPPHSVANGVLDALIYLLQDHLKTAE
jgi:phosphorylase kinase alpha/beta subunit